MEPLGRILRRHNDQRPEGQSFSASAVLAVVNKVLYQHLDLDPRQATAKSLKHGVVTIQVQHPAMAGRIMIEEKKLIEYINSTLHEQFPGYQAPLTGLRSRVYDDDTVTGR